MDSSRTHGDGRGPGALAHGGGPIDVEDIDRVLRDSAGLGADTPHASAVLREWRADLSVALAALVYAREILTADIALVHRCLAMPGTPSSPAEGLDDLIAHLPRVLTSPSSRTVSSVGEIPARGPAESEDPGRSIEDEDIAQVVARSDRLVAAHRVLASTDLSVPAELAYALGVLEAQLTTLAEHQGAVAARLQEIRAVVLRQYAERSGPDGSPLEAPA